MACLLHVNPGRVNAGRAMALRTLVTGLMLLFVSRGMAQPIDVPIVQKPHEHEAAQFGYKPWYIPNVPAFDKYNRPYMRSRATDPHTTGSIQTLRSGRWVQREFVSAIREVFPGFAAFRYGGGTLGSCITFDADDDLYTLVRIRLKDESEHDLLIYSRDYGKTFQVYELPTEEPPHSHPTGFANMEYRVGHNDLTRPPLLTTLRKRADHPLGAWTAHYNMYLIQPRKENGRLVFDEPVLLTDHGLYMSRHAGNPSFAVSGPDKTYITWGQTTDHQYFPGVPTFIATFDPKSNSVSDRQFCGYGYPVNNGHNSPGVVMDDEGYLHVLTGSHGENFMYSRSLEPHSTAAGMTEPVPSLKTGWEEFGHERGRQCYLSFVCTADGTLHAVFRQWFQRTEPYFEDSHFGGLAHLRKPKGGPWEERSQLLVVPPLDEYSIYYQDLTIDRKDRIYVSYGYRSAYESYGTGEAENHYMAVIMSEDGGDHWQLMTTGAFLDGIDETAHEDKQAHPATVRGVVVDTQGQPLPGATVTAINTSVTTGPQGGFEFDAVLADEFDLTVELSGYETGTAPVKLHGAAEGDVTIRLEPAQES